MEFQFTTISKTKLYLTMISIFIIWLTGVILTAVYLKNHYLLILCSVGISAFVALKHSFFFKALPLTVLIDENGFELKEKFIYIRWNELVWYNDMDKGKESFFNQLTLKLKNKKKVGIFYFRKNNNQQDWYRFTEHFFSMMRKNCPDIKNYYDNPVWDKVIYFLIALSILIPLILIILKIKIIAVLGSFLGFSSAAISTYAQIRSNRTQQKAVKPDRKTEPGKD
jgi:hypothetical protein